jgi:hypothetical protein
MTHPGMVASPAQAEPVGEKSFFDEI